jgi:hypothetical protein
MTAEHALISVYDEDDVTWLGFGCMCGWSGEHGASREGVEEHITSVTSPGGSDVAEKDVGRVRPSVLRQVIAEAMDRAEAAGMDRRTTEEWISIEILASPLIPLTTEAPLRMTEAEVAPEQQSWFRQEYERSKKRNEALGAHGMVVTGTGFDVPTRVLPPGEQP